MGYLGILEDKKLPHVPGTVVLDEETARSELLTSGLKHGTGKNAHIVLAPQPSDDPNDPLNWPYSKKLTVMIITAFGTILYAAVLGPLTNAGLVIIATEFNVTLTDVNLLSGYQILVVGATAPFVSAWSRKYGKRALFLFSSIMALIADIIGSTSHDFNGLKAARVIQGFSISAYESLLLVTIGDLFFVHERGYYTSAVNFLLAAVSNLASVVCGPITTNLGWKYLFHILIALGGFQTILQFFFCPETTYRRDHRYDIDELATDNLEALAVIEQQKQLEKTDANAGATTAEHVESGARSPNQQVYKKETYWQSLRLYSGTYTDENIFQLVIATFAVCMNLSVTYIIISQGWFVGLYVAVAFTLAQIFGYPPYNLDAAGIGYLSIGPFLGGLVGMLFFGAINDPIIKYMTRKNNGVYEPEYRLLMGLGGLASGVGLFGFGYVAQNYGSYYLTSFLHAIIIFGVMSSIVSTSSYALDAYRDMSSEIFIMGMLFKNMLLYGFTYFINDWMARDGPAIVFYTFGATGFGIMIGMPIMFVFGKKYRGLWCRHNLLEKFHIRTHAE